MRGWHKFVLYVAAGLQLSAQQLSSPLVSTGAIEIGGRAVPYTIRRLPVTSFPDLPQAVAAELGTRECLIPQTYEARRPENVVHGSFEAPGSSDWAVLCFARGTVSLLVFFGSAEGKPAVLATAAETDRLQEHTGSAVLGFNWGIDSASPERVHEAQSGLSPRPARLDHDALADATVDRGAVFRYFAKGQWTVVPLPD